MAKGVIKVATCQFAVGADIKRNSRRVCAYLDKARKAKADIVHFPECALSGYASVDYKTFDGYDWDLLKKEAQKVIALVGKLRLWVVLGSAYRLTEPNKPHNSLYLIGPEGDIIDRYDKRFCTEIDLANFTPGNHFVNFDINGVKCSLLICFDLRFPEIYRQLKKRKVDCIFQSFYNARQKGPSVHTDIMRQTMQCRAATNHFWVSMANSSGYYSPYPSCFIQPDGKIAAQLGFNRAGMMINTVDLGKVFYDPSAKFREMAMKGRLSNGQGSIKDPRSRNSKTL
ncbi:MAG TPA: carbon-nitrogen hydrolase family protein [Planctomycetes bacterium]|nr:carbon-nitrogen hydrolase family protein [Planctomycetota bacterium]